MTGAIGRIEDPDLLDEDVIEVMDPKPDEERVEIPDKQINLSVRVEHEDEKDMFVTFLNQTKEDGYELDTVSVEDGEEANFTWEEREYDTEYNWSVIVTDGDENTTESDVWGFKTEKIPNEPELERPKPEPEVSISPDMETELNVSVRHPEGKQMNVTFHNATDDVEIGYELVEDEGNANTTWGDLEYGTEYEWYVNVTEEENDNSTISETWNFTTEGIDIELEAPDDGEEDVDLNPTLSVNVTHPGEEQMNVTFYNATDDVEIGNVTEVESGELANYTWENLEFNTTYEWYVEVEEADNNLTEKSENWTFTTTEEEIIEYELTINIEGEGTVTVEWNDEEHDVVDDETFDIDEETNVNLTAIPDENWTFDEWDGTDDTENEITITMDEDKTITAYFEEAEEAYYVVEITSPEEGDRVARYDVGDTVVVRVDIENTGNKEGEKDILLEIGGVEQDRWEDLNLEAGGNESIILIWDYAQPGIQRLDVVGEDDDQVEGDHVYITVEETLPMPGFTSLLLLLAVTFAAVIYHKKKR